MDSEKKETILFVDDEESILSVSAEYFQRRGYQTLTAKGGLEALNILEHETVDCCFTDINMPEMNGLELAEKIRINALVQVWSQVLWHGFKEPFLLKVLNNSLCLSNFSMAHLDCFVSST